MVWAIVKEKRDNSEESWIVKGGQDKGKKKRGRASKISKKALYKGGYKKQKRGGEYRLCAGKKKRAG